MAVDGFLGNTSIEQAGGKITEAELLEWIEAVYNAELTPDNYPMEKLRGR